MALHTLLCRTRQHCGYRQTIAKEFMRWPYPAIPEIGRNLPSKYGEGEIVFDERVKARFPKGMRTTDLVVILRHQGFRIDESGPHCRSASMTRGMLIKTLWSVRWQEEEGQVEAIWGVYGAIAP